MIKIRKILYIFFIVFFIINCSYAVLSRKIVSVMSYNLENLFDTSHDEGKNDWIYLPKSFKDQSSELQEYCSALSDGYYKERCFGLDWNEQLLSKKIQNLSRVIKNYDDGSGPDILVVQEVENIHVLRQLNTIGDLGFSEVILLEGPDSRGIDVGILSKYPLQGSPILHKVDFSELHEQGLVAKETRGILQASFDVEGRSLTVFSNHWPSQRNIDQTRHVAAKTLKRAVAAVSDSAVVALGDFNTASSDDPHGINLELLNPESGISFLEVSSTVAEVPWPEGSYFYRGNWGFLDLIFFPKHMVDTPLMSVLWDTYMIGAYDFVLHDVKYENDETGEIIEYSNIPWRFDTETGQGYSDHLSIAVKVQI